MAGGNPEEKYICQAAQAPIFRCVHYFTLCFSLISLEVLFTHSSKQSSGRHLFPLLKENPLKRQIVQCTWLGSLENVVLAKIYQLHVPNLQKKKVSTLSHTEDKMREIGNWNFFFFPWVIQDGELKGEGGSFFYLVKTLILLLSDLI